MHGLGLLVESRAVSNGDRGVSDECSFPSTISTGFPNTRSSAQMARGTPKTVGADELGPCVVEALKPNNARPPAIADGMPMVRIPRPERSSLLLFVMTAMDHRGRLAERSALKHLGWQPGTPISIRIVDSCVLLIQAGQGAHSVTGQGYLRIPSSVRHACRLTAGARLLLVACAEHDVLAAYTATAIDAMLLAFHRGLAHG